MKNYSVETLEKMQSKAWDKYYELTNKPCGNWGDGMRLSKLPQNKAWEKAREKYYKLEEAVKLKRQGLSIEQL